MKEVKTQKRYKCDFCNKRSVKRVIEIHEKRCFRNPNRFCDYCDNVGYFEEHIAGVGTHKEDCPYCKMFDKKMLKEIEEREKKDKEISYPND